jgi:uncharacterized protein YceH (UPF0502 family)
VIAVLAELLLRGPQTEGDLRSRVSRMEPVADLDALRAVCQPLAHRGLVTYLTPEGRRGTTLTHGFHDPQELDRLRSRAGTVEPVAHPPRPAEPAPPPAGRLDQIQAEIAELREVVSRLQHDVSGIRSQLEELQAALGVRPSL